MPHLPTVDMGDGDPEELVFPPVTKDHIMNCSCDVWYPQFRKPAIRSRIIPLPPAFIEYLQEDGIILADELGPLDQEDDDWQPTATSKPRVEEISPDNDDESESEEEAEAPLPPNLRFPETHALIKEKIQELGGCFPKLNWSSPKDAKWISNHQNTLKCTSPNDLYLLLKSSSFISHDLNHAFDDCTSAPASKPFTPVLVLRPFINSLNPALEFRCFVKHRNLIAITQRDLLYYEFLADLRPKLQTNIKAFFDKHLKLSFPDSCFTFDIHVFENQFDEQGLGPIRMLDINPWAPRTDTLLFTWRELLDMEVSRPLYGSVSQEELDGEISDDETATETEDEDSPDGVQRRRLPEFRVLEKDDPAAFNFSSPQYSAHKLPKEVVDASSGGSGGLREFLTQWRNLTEGRGEGVFDQATQQPGSST